MLEIRRYIFTLICFKYLVCATSDRASQSDLTSPNFMLPILKDWYRAARAAKNMSFIIWGKHFIMTLKETFLIWLWSVKIPTESFSYLTVASEMIMGIMVEAILDEKVDKKMDNGHWYACVVWVGVWVWWKWLKGEVGLDMMEVGVVVEEEMEWQGKMVCLCLYVIYYLDLSLRNEVLTGRAFKHYWEILH